MSERTAPAGDRQQPEGLARLAARLSGRLEDPALLRQALTHRSYCAEVAGSASNERLEYLGDAVLGLVVAEDLYRRLPGVPEGDLARMRAALVSEDALAPVAVALGLGDAVLLGRGEALSGGREKVSILTDALEALVGAAYLEGGLDAARSLVLEVMGELIDDVVGLDELGDAKNRLQELSARLGFAPPRYTVRESGPDHAKRYAAEVTVPGAPAGAGPVGQGEGRSKKQAERAAATEALRVLAPEPAGS